jgi:hypothetical protein
MRAQLVIVEERAGPKRWVRRTRHCPTRRRNARLSGRPVPRRRRCGRTRVRSRSSTPQGFLRPARTSAPSRRSVAPDPDMGPEPRIVGQAVLANPTRVLRHRRPRLQMLVRRSHRGKQTGQAQIGNGLPQNSQHEASQSLPLEISSHADIEGTGNIRYDVMAGVGEGPHDGLFPTAGRQLCAVPAAQPQLHRLGVRDDRAVLRRRDQAGRRERFEGLPEIGLGDPVVAHEVAPAADVDLGSRELRPLRDGRDLDSAARCEEMLHADHLRDATGQGPATRCRRSRERTTIRSNRCGWW